MSKLVGEREIELANKRWMENGCDQCWSCKNCVGHNKEAHILPGIPDPDAVLLPVCRVEDKYMTVVFDRPCRKYVGKEPKVDNQIFTPTRIAADRAVIVELRDLAGRLDRRDYYDDGTICQAGSDALSAALGEIERLQKRLERSVELPCEWGDRVYSIYCDSSGNPDGEIEPVDIDYFYVDEKGVGISTGPYDGHIGHFKNSGDLDEYGIRRVYFTLAEAEAALQKGAPNE